MSIALSVTPFLVSEWIPSTNTVFTLITSDLKTPKNQIFFSNRVAKLPLDCQIVALLPTHLQIRWFGGFFLPPWHCVGGRGISASSSVQPGHWNRFLIGALRESSARFESAGIPKRGESAGNAFFSRDFLFVSDSSIWTGGFASLNGTPESSSE